MLHKEFWGLLFLAFVAWIILATTPQKRIEHACRPIAWVGNVITSGSALAIPSQQTTIQKWFDKLEYGCQYTTWRLFYQEEYNKWLAEEERRRQELVNAQAAKKASEKDANKPGDQAQGAEESKDDAPSDKQEASEK